MARRLSLLLAVLVASAGSGCAFGRKFSYADSKVDVGAMRPGGSVALAVVDQREYVRAGKKPASFIGLSRGGFGNPFDVSTTSGAPLATEMAGAIAAGMRAHGVEVRVVDVAPAGGAEGARKVLGKTGAGRQLLFVLDEWKTDSMARTGLDFDVSLVVYDVPGTELARARLSGKKVSDSTVGGAEADAQAWFAAVAAELLQAEAVAGALR